MTKNNVATKSGHFAFNAAETCSCVACFYIHTHLSWDSVGRSALNGRLESHSRIGTLLLPKQKINHATYSIFYYKFTITQSGCLNWIELTKLQIAVEAIHETLFDLKSMY